MTETSTPLAESPRPTTNQPHPILRRSDSNRMLGGVCGGLSEHTGIDVILFRVGFVVLTVAGGAGLVLYLALWLLLPEANGTPGSVQRWLSGRSSNTLRNVVLVIAAVFALGAILDGGGGGSGVIAVLAVAALAYLWARDHNRAPTVEPNGTASLEGDPTPVAVAPARPPRRRSALGRITISALLIILGVLALLDRQTDVDVSTTGYLATALGVIGVGLLVGTIWGRSRGLILLGIPLVILLAGAATFDVSLRDGLGERFWQPQSVESIDSTYRYGMGQGQLDLSTVDFEDADLSTEVRLGIGYVQVLVPADVDVTVTADIRAGAMELFGVNAEGSSDLRRTVTDTGADGPGGGQLNLAVDLGLGFVEVTRVG